MNDLTLEQKAEAFDHIVYLYENYISNWDLDSMLVMCPNSTECFVEELANTLGQHLDRQSNQYVRERRKTDSATQLQTISVTYHGGGGAGGGVGGGAGGGAVIMGSSDGISKVVFYTEAGVNISLPH